MLSKEKIDRVFITYHILMHYEPVLGCVDIAVYKKKIDCSQCPKKFNACKNLIYLLRLQS